VKAFIFLVFSILIHCYIFSTYLTRNGQDSPLNKPLLRGVKPVEKLETFTSPREPKLFAPSKLSPQKIATLSYRDGLIYLFQTKAVYPIAAQDLEQSGTVVLSVELDKDGKLIGFKIHQKSDYKVLNEAALETAAHIKIYKPLPRTLHPYATFLVPIHYL